MHPQSVLLCRLSAVSDARGGQLNGSGAGGPILPSPDRNHFHCPLAASRQPIAPGKVGRRSQPRGTRSSGRLALCVRRSIVCECRHRQRCRRTWHLPWRPVRSVAMSAERSDRRGAVAATCDVIIRPVTSEVCSCRSVTWCHASTAVTAR